MKVELNAEELDRLLAPYKDAHKEVIRLTGEVARLESSSPAAVSEGTTSLINVLTNVCSALANGNKLTAIKLVREFTRCGLKEAKDIVEGNYNGPGVTRVV